MWLYSAQGLEKPKYKETTAEKAGLSAHLGYRPLFCSYVNPDSLSDTWFRIWSAAPGRVDELWLMEVDDSEVITLDSLLWTNGYLSGEKKDFDKVLNTPFCESTDLLIKPDTQPKQIYKFPFLDIINGTYDDWDIANEEKVVWLFITQQIREFQQSSRIYGTDDNFVSSDPSSVTCEQWYGLATYTGLIAYIWAIATGRREKRFNKFLSIYDTAALRGALSAAGPLMYKWDEAAAGNGSFSRDEFLEMRNIFIRGANLYGQEAAKSVADEEKIGRNDPCFCGSGLKYKKCHGQMSLDEMAKNERNI